MSGRDELSGFANALMIGESMPVDILQIFVLCIWHNSCCKGELVKCGIWNSGISI